MSLPVKNIILYKHGVGYFERVGEVQDDAKINLCFRAGEMNDVLKSLTVLDLNGGIIASISYESIKSVQKQLEDISLRLPDQDALSGLLTQLKGAQVTIELAAGVIGGVVIGIESVQHREKDATFDTKQLVLLIDGKQITAYDLTDIKHVTLVNEELNKDLQHVLDVTLSANKRETKQLTLFTKGSGKRNVLASYVIESPVWKTSYRLLLEDNKAHIQGWAIVDNTTDEDWDNVNLTLIAGMPISFIHDLYTSRFKRRPVVEVKLDDVMAPPDLESGFLQDEAVEMLSQDWDAESAVLTAPSAALTRTRGGPFAAKAKRSALQKSAPVRVQTAELSDLFQYQISHPVTVKRGQSALVPILFAPFEGKRVAIYNPDARDKYPMSAVLFKNTTGLTLESGPVTVLEDSVYVGEAMLDTLQADETKLVPFSVELGCVVTLDRDSSKEDVHLCKIHHGVMYLYRYQIEKTIYRIDNKTGRNIDLFLDHRFKPDWKLVSEVQPAEQTEHFYRFRTTAAAKQATLFTVMEKGDLHESYSIQSVDTKRIGVWLQRRYIDETTHHFLEEIIALNKGIAEYNAAIEKLEKERNHIVADQKRLRENLQALGASQHEKSLRERYIGDMTVHEDTLAQIKTQIASLEAKRQEDEKRVAQLVENLSFSNEL